MCETFVEMKNLWLKKNVHNYQNNCNKLFEKPSIVSISNGVSKKPKRFRSAFTTEQVNLLEREYKKCPYVGMEHRTEIATTLNIPERAVKIWFQNRRMKEKKESSTKECCDEQISRVSQPMEFDRNRLNNVITMQSANDQSLNLLPLLRTDVNNTSKLIENNNNNMVYVDIKHQPPKNEIFSKDCQNPNQHKPGEKLLTFLKSRGLQKESTQSNLNMCERFKKENKVQATIQISKTDSSPVSQSPFNQNIAPEDLSAKKSVLLQPEQTPVRHSHCISGYFPVVPSFYPQPFVSPEGVLWKPVNVMPMVSGPTHISNKEFESGAQEQNAIPKMCNCNCHMKSYPIIGHQNFPSPQYVLTALPFKKPSTK